MSLEIDIQLKRSDFALNFKADLNAGITGLSGPSGSGKTTLLQCIAGLINPDSGTIRLNHTILYDGLLNTSLPTRKRQIGFVFQDPLLFPHLTVKKNLTYGQKGRRPERKQHLWHIAELLEIGHLMKRKPYQLSGGEKQRVALGRAILNFPRLLLLDEPFTGLDADLKRQILPCLRRLYETTQIPMVLVSHNADELAELTDEQFFIEKGQLLARGKLAAPRPSRAVGRFCQSDNPNDFQKMRHLLIRNHSLQFLSNPNTQAV